jgi:hypothetical protein
MTLNSVARNYASVIKKRKSVMIITEKTNLSEKTNLLYFIIVKTKYYIKCMKTVKKID